MNASHLELSHLEFSNSEVMGATKKAAIVEPTIFANAPGGLREISSVTQIQQLGFDSGTRLKVLFDEATIS